LGNEQVVFSVKQGKPKTIEAAVSATLECESHLVRSSSVSYGAVAPVQVNSTDGALMDVMMQLMAWIDKLEGNTSELSYGKGDAMQKKTVDREIFHVKKWCNVFAMGRSDILHGVVLNPRSHQGQKTRILWGILLASREFTKALDPRNVTISIVNLSSSFSFTATINSVPVEFLVDIGSALTILQNIYMGEM